MRYARSICFYCQPKQIDCKNYDYFRKSRNDIKLAAAKPLAYINMPLKLSGPVWISHFSTQKSRITEKSREIEREMSR